MRMSFVVICSLLFLAHAAHAAGIKTSGFLTTGTVFSDSKTKYDLLVNHKPNIYYDSKVGLNFNSQVSNDWSAAVQLLNSYDKVTDKFKLKADWAFATYRPFQGLSLRLGKQRNSNWLISEHYDVGFLYPWVRPPLEVYSLIPMSTFYGAVIEYEYIFPTITVNFEISGGRTPFDLKYTTLVDNATAEAVVNTIYGTTRSAPFLMEGTLAGVGDSYSTHLSLSTDDLLLRGGWGQSPHAEDTNEAGVFDYKYDFWSLGAKYDYLDSFIYFEYANGKTENNLTKKEISTTNAFYVTIGHKIGIVTPHLTYAQLKTDRKETYLDTTLLHSAYKDKQSSYTIGLVTATSSKSDFKVEYQRISVDKYGAFKTATVMKDDVGIFSIAVDLIF